MAVKKPAAKKPKPVGPKLCKGCGQISPETVEKCLYCGETL